MIVLGVYLDSRGGKGHSIVTRETEGRRQGGFQNFPWLTRADGDAPDADVVVRREDVDPDWRRFDGASEAFVATAHRVQYVWLGFLTVMLFFAVSAANTTHRMLFLEEGVKLPIVDITIPVTGFYIVGPALFVILHFYVLAALVALARTSQIFEDAVSRLKIPEAERENLRGRLGTALFAQLISGRHDEQHGWVSVLFTAVAMLTVAILPVLTLLFMQLMFLPYQSDWITWLHRCFVALDLAIVFLLWRSYRHGRGALFSLPTGRGIIGVGLYGVFSGLAVTGTLAASFPCALPIRWEKRMAAEDWGRCETGLEEAVRSFNRWIEPHLIWLTRADTEYDAMSLADFSGVRLADKWLERGAQYGPFTVFVAFPNRMKLDDAVLVDPKETNLLIAARQERARELEAQGDQSGGEQAEGKSSMGPAQRSNETDRYSFDARGRNFRAARLARADLNVVNFERADLSLSSLSDARLSYANLASTKLLRANLDETYLNNADLTSANLSYAGMYGTKLKQSERILTNMIGAVLQDISISGFWPVNASGAYLTKVKWKDADIYSAEFSGAKLSGVSFEKSRITNSNLAGADVKGGDFRGATISGTSFAAARLSEVNLDWAVLQDRYTESVVENKQNWNTPSDLRGATIDTVSALGGFSYRPSILRGDRPIEPISILHAPEVSNTFDEFVTYRRPEKITFEDWRDRILSFIDDNDHRSEVKQRLDRLDPKLQKANPAVSSGWMPRTFLDDQKREPDFQALVQMCRPDVWPYARERMASTGYLTWFSDKRRETMLSRMTASRNRFKQAREADKYAQPDPDDCPGPATDTDDDFAMIQAAFRNASDPQVLRGLSNGTDTTSRLVRPYPGALAAAEEATEAKAAAEKAAAQKARKESRRGSRRGSRRQDDE
jgi:uncharacterized protein YjbI with pentapeptide repeats